MSNTLFPVFLKTDTAHFLIVGAGNVGLEKTETLLRQNPAIRITIIGIQIHLRLKQIVDSYANITFFERPFEENDLAEKDFVIIATDSAEVNLNVRNLAKGRGIKVNAADQPDLCDFYLGSIVNKGNLKIAISTNGKSPVLAKRMREYFTAIIPDTIDENLAVLHQFRSNHKGDLQQKLKDLNTITAAFSVQKKSGFWNKFKRLFAIN